MKRPINICSGQFGDMPLEDLCREMNALGYNGFEIATQAHVDVNRIVSDEKYREEFKATLAKYDMQIGALSAHLAGQCVGDNWDTAGAGVLCPSYQVNLSNTCAMLLVQLRIAKVNRETR